MEQIQRYNMSGFFVPDILYTVASILSKIGIVFCLHSDYFWDSLHVHIYEVCPVKIFLICIFQPIFLNKQIYILILNLSLIYNLIVPTYIISIIIVCGIFVLYTILPIFERKRIISLRVQRLIVLQNVLLLVMMFSKKNMTQS